MNNFMNEKYISYIQNRELFPKEYEHVKKEGWVHISKWSFLLCLRKIGIFCVKPWVKAQMFCILHP